MTRRLARSDEVELTHAERDIRAVLDGRPFDFEAMAAISNVYRTASTVRRHMESGVLADEDLSFAAFTVLWVLWIWGEHEAGWLADEAGITKGTLTGVLRTLEDRGLVRRRAHAQDRRRMLVNLTRRGRSSIERVFPRFNAEESDILEPLSHAERVELARLLRRVQDGVAARDLID